MGRRVQKTLRMRTITNSLKRQGNSSPQKHCPYIQLNLRNGAETLFNSVLGQLTHELLGSEDRHTALIEPQRILTESEPVFSHKELLSTSSQPGVKYHVFFIWLFFYLVFTLLINENEILSVIMLPIVTRDLVTKGRTDFIFLKGKTVIVELLLLSCPCRLCACVARSDRRDLW